MPGYSLSRPSSWMLPFLLAAFLLCTAPSWPSLFNATTRWGFLALGFVWVLSQRRLGVVFGDGLRLATALLLLWPLATVFWSQDASLSLTKGALFAATACTMFALGAMWSLKRPELEVSNVLLPFFITYLLLLTVAGLPTGVAMGYKSLYEGAGNPNLTGIAAAISLPLVLWHIFRKPTSRPWLWWGAAAFIAYIFLATLARGSIMVAGITAFGCLIGLGTRRNVIWLVSVLMIISLPLLMPPKLLSAVESYLYESVYMKGALSNPNVADYALASREVPMQEQLRAAKAGGVLGGGYGVQIEVGHFIYINDRPIGFAPGTYKREKANSALAILEEQGWVGLIITIFWLLAFFRRCIAWYRRIPPGNGRLQMGILTAFMFGMMLNSLVEAWWVSPGALETLVFWSMAGVTYGLGSRYAAAAAEARMDQTG